MKRIMLAAVAMLVFCTANTFAQNLKIGIVDVQTIISEMPDFKKAEDALTAFGKKYQDSLVALNTAMEEKYAAFQKQQAMMPEEEKKKVAEELQMMQLQMQQLQQVHFGQGGTVAQKQEELLEPLRVKIKKAIEDVAKAENINIVLTKNPDVVLYSEQKMDITYRVLDQLNRGSGK
jgi:outer membrane protein